MELMSDTSYPTLAFPFQALPFQTFVRGPALSNPTFRLPSIVMMNPDGVAAENASSFGNYKAALSFILSSDSESDDESKNRKRDSLSEPTVAKRRRSVTSTSGSPTASKPTKKGSKFCTVDGCSSRAKHAKRCWKHGGWVRCKVTDCANRAKSKGVCWSHGGGTACSFESCDTIAVSNGFCWAHGGGKRCQVANCVKPAYERTQNFCQTHYEQFGARSDSYI